MNYPHPYWIPLPLIPSVLKCQCHYHITSHFVSIHKLQAILMRFLCSMLCYFSWCTAPDPKYANLHTHTQIRRRRTEPNRTEQIWFYGEINKRQSNVNDAFCLARTETTNKFFRNAFIRIYGVIGVSKFICFPFSIHGTSVIGILLLLVVVRMRSCARMRSLTFHFHLPSKFPRG